MSARRFPWAALQRYGLGVLKWPPEQFWRASLRDLAAAWPKPLTAPPDRAALDDLMQRFPDEP